MTEKKYQVFISSTYSDLIDERRKILDILLKADCIPAGMELFVATDEEQFEVIKKVINLCDYYVLIIGKRYGTLNPTTNLSYTEMEYDYAKEKCIPVLVFAIDESVSLPEDKIDIDPIKIEKLRLFRNKAMGNRLASVWKSSEELTGHLAISIMSAKAEISRPGWQRAVDFDEASLRRDIMQLQTEKKDLAIQLLEANKKIEQFRTENNFAFEECTYDIKYEYWIGTSKQYSNKIATLPEIFSVIALQMLDVSVTEEIISTVIKSQILKRNDSHVFFSDSQIVKRIMHQLKASGLVNSFWNKDKSNLYWGLTDKGQMKRDELLLIKKDV